MKNDGQKELVSIGLPTFNRASILKRAVDSLLAQTYTNFELIISDNASTDDTEKICREYAQRDRRVRYFRQEPSIGMMGQFDFLIDKKRGDFYMLASDDDWWNPDFILKLKNKLDSHPECGVAMSSLKQIHEDGSFVNEIVFGDEVSKFGHSRLFNSVIFKNPPTHFFIMGLFRATTLRDINWEPTPRVLGGDKIFMYEASLLTRFCSVPDVLWIRTSSLLPDAQRYTGDYKKVFIHRWAYFKHLSASFSRLFRSPNIDLKKKLTLLPIKIIVLIWAYRKHIMRELFPPIFGILTWLNKRKL